MIQKVTVVPFWMAFAAGLLAVELLLSLLLPPQAARARASTAAISHEAIASFLRISASPPARKRF
jgi:hypothetical protein